MDSKIQIITYPPISDKYGEDIKISYFDRHDSVDSYKYNIINLNNQKLWNYDKVFNKFSEDDNLQTLIQSIENNNQKSYFIINLPTNIKSKQYSQTNTKDYWIKNNIPRVLRFLKEYFNLYHVELVYGLNKTKLSKYEVHAEFYIRTENEDYTILTRNSNGKITSIKHENIILTTLQLTSRMEIINFINDTLLKKEIEIPDWFEEIEMFDDALQKDRIKKNNLNIEKLNEDNKLAYDILNENNEYKSILYKQSGPLVKSVFKILEDMLNYDLSDFVDVFKEDFLIKFDDVTFIGEIKGVSRNVTRNHLSQTDDHVTEREDLLEEKGETENIQPLLIINRFIDLPPSERPAVDKTTIKKAEEKYKTLIITTEELLKLYAHFKNGNITSEEIIERFKNEIGLFEL